MADTKRSLEATGSRQMFILLYSYKAAPRPGLMVQKVIVAGLLVDNLPHRGTSHFKENCTYLSKGAQGRVLASHAPTPQMR